MTTPGVDFFRVDRSGPTRRLLAISGVFVACGASSVGAHLMHRLDTETGHVVSLVGGVVMIGGLVLAFGSLAMMLFENVYLAIRDDALVLHDNGKETIVAWDDLTGVSAERDKKGFVTLKRKSGKPVAWYAGTESETVAAKVEDARRKALHGLLKTGSNPPPSS